MVPLCCLTPGLTGRQPPGLTNLQFTSETAGKDSSGFELRTELSLPRRCKSTGEPILINQSHLIFYTSAHTKIWKARKQSVANRECKALCKTLLHKYGQPTRRSALQHTWPSQNISDKLQSGIRDEGASEASSCVCYVLLPAPPPPPAGTWLPRYKAFNGQVVTEYKAARQIFKLHNLPVQMIVAPFKIGSVFLWCLLFLKTCFILFGVCFWSSCPICKSILTINTSSCSHNEFFFPIG